jgi:hypothetical protein
VRRILAVLLMLFSLWLVGGVAAQDSTQPEPGDPPVTALISVSEPDEAGVVTISGAQGAVFPAAQVAIRNLFTGATVYTTAGFTGSFSASLYGPGPTPFLVSPAEDIPPDLRDRPGSLPGGPATIIYGSNPVPRPVAQAITSLQVDGVLDDWSAYPQARLIDQFYALINADSLYIGFEREALDGAEVVVIFTLDSITYELTIDPRLPQAALIREIAPTEREQSALAVAVGVDTAIELRITLAAIDATVETATLEQIFLRVGAEPQDVTTTATEIPTFAERDGIVYPDGPLDGDITRFYMAGPLAQGASFWSGIGRINTLTPSPGDTVTLEIDATLRVPELSDSLPDLNLIGQIGLQPITVGSDGEQNVTARFTNNGWSNILTSTGLAVDNVVGDVNLETITVPAAQVVRRGDTLLAGFRFTLTIPNNLPQGLYVPTFTGLARIGDGEVFTWHDAGVFGTGPGAGRVPFTRLPVVLNIGSVDSGRLMWSLFHDQPSDGSRGILPAEDDGLTALSNRVRYNSPTYILSPGAYSLEPYLLNQMPNAYDTQTTPLIPLLFPGGRVQANVTGPDGQTDELTDAPVTQSLISTAALDERDVFGGQPPLDVYQLGTANSAYRAYEFDQYGAYTIELTGNVDDVSGNRYEGGGLYTLLIAELLDLTPGVLPGTPFALDDALFVGGRVSPAYPAEVTVTVTVTTLDGDTSTVEFTGQADNHGYFDLETGGFRFLDAGEYLIDYEARYTDADGRLWAASLRSAGIIASAGPDLVAHGQRGVDGVFDVYRPAWFNTDVYPPFEALADVDLRPNLPYFSGDIAYIPDQRESGLHTALSVQDTQQAYRNWLQSGLPDDFTLYGLAIERLAALDELPLSPVLGGPLNAFSAALLQDFIVNNAYAYISVVRPAVTVRQFVTGNAEGTLPLYFDNDDPLNGQIGAGEDGNLPGDYLFLFGGAVVKNAEAGVREAVPYAALGIVRPDDEAARVVPPLRGEKDDAIPPLRIVDGTAVDAFVHLTGLRPGQLLPQGTRLSFAGQVAPTLPTTVDVLITAPDGSQMAATARTNPTGYFYLDTLDLTADLPGRWLVTVRTTPGQDTSTGPVPAAIPNGRLPGGAQTFPIYVLPADPTVLDWSLNGDADLNYVPGNSLNLSVDIPDTWTEASAFFSTTTPAYLMEAAELQIFATSASYQFNPFGLSERFPFEVSGAGDGPSGSDVVTVTFFVTGLDDTGTLVGGYRQLFIFHDRLISVDAREAMLEEE